MCCWGRCFVDHGIEKAIKAALKAPSHSEVTHAGLELIKYVWSPFLELFLETDGFFCFALVLIFVHSQFWHRDLSIVYPTSPVSVTYSHPHGSTLYCGLPVLEYGYTSWLVRIWHHFCRSHSGRNIAWSWACELAQSLQKTLYDGPRGWLGMRNWGQCCVTYHAMPLIESKVHWPLFW
jgi:hypothetical protein